jgi:hypothetical protein
MSHPFLVTASLVLARERALKSLSELADLH